MELKIRKNGDYSSFLRFVSNSENIFFNMNKQLPISFLLESSIKIGSADFEISTLPGDAQKAYGTWYYIVSRRKAHSLIHLFYRDELLGFDPNNLFLTLN